MQRLPDHCSVTGVFDSQLFSAHLAGGGLGRHSRWDAGDSNGREWWELLGGATERHCRHQEPGGTLQWPALRRPKWQRWARERQRGMKKMDREREKEHALFYNFIQFFRAFFSLSTLVALSLFHSLFLQCFVLRMVLGVPVIDECHIR